MLMLMLRGCRSLLHMMRQWQVKVVPQMWLLEQVCL
jgi:hypothetical protein